MKPTTFKNRNIQFFDISLSDFDDSKIYSLEKKQDDLILESLTLEERMVNYSNDVLGIRVSSVSLPENYNPETRGENEMLNWLQNRIKNKYSSAFNLAKKYEEKLNIKLDQKKPYANQ